MTEEVDFLVEELKLGSARGGARQGAPVTVDVVRSLGEGDLPLLASPGPLGSKLPELQEIKHQHHKLASLVARGVDDKEISAIMGYSPAYISNLKNQALFGELVDYYKEQNKELLVNAAERLLSLGVTGIEELQRRLDQEPEKWTKNELMDLIEMGILKPKALAQGAGRGGATGSPAVSVHVQFVQAEQKDNSPMIEGTAEEI